MVKSYRQSRGQLGEYAAKHFIVTQHRWCVIAQNWRYQRYGEIDLVALDSERNILHFIEVKTRHETMEQGDPLEALTTQKQERMRILVEAFMQQPIAEQFVNVDISIDLFAVYVQGNQVIKQALVENIWG